MAGVLRQPLLRSRAPAPLFSLPTQASKPSQLQLSQRRAVSARAPSRRNRNADGEWSPSVSAARMRDGQPSAMIGFRIPQTFVSPGLTKYISQPATFAKMFWWGLQTRVRDYMAELSMRIQSKPSFFTAAAYKPNKKAIGPMAKNMHYQMLEATAAGDLPTLRRLLTTAHLDEISGLIARRPRGQKVKWELLSYKGKPTIANNKVMMVPGPMPMYIRQVVVTIRSRQRFTWTQEDTAAAHVGNGSRRKAAAAAATAKPAVEPRVVEKDVKENVILVAVLDRSTWNTTDWRIFGFIEDTTPESWLKENELVTSASKNGATQIGTVNQR